MIALRGVGRAWNCAFWLIAAGCALRTVEFAANRGYWLDESSLHANLQGGLAPGPARALVNNQLVPPLFLWLERLLVQLFDESRPVTRLPPFVASLVALPLLRAFTRRALAPGAALLALALLAFSDEHIYYCSELKPYSIDAAAALAVLVVYQHFAAAPRARALVLLAATGAVLIWLSFPVCFVLAAVGLLAIARAARARRPREVVVWTVISLFWLLNFGVMHRMASTLLGDGRGMQIFWNFAFPPALWVDPLWIPRRLLFLFVNPLDFWGPFDPRWSALPAIACAIVGASGLVLNLEVANSPSAQDHSEAQARPGLSAHASLRPRELATLLLGPLVLALAAAALRLYPFHGRCLLFLTPGLMILIALGAQRLAAGRGSLVRLLLLGLLLGNSLFLDAAHLFGPRYRSGLNPHGDRRPAWMQPDIFSLPARQKAANRSQSP